MYLIINKQTGQIVGKASTLSGARRSRDRRDNEYGAYVHYIKTTEGSHKL